MLDLLQSEPKVRPEKPAETHGGFLVGLLSKGRQRVTLGLHESDERNPMTDQQRRALRRAIDQMLVAGKRSSIEIKNDEFTFAATFTPHPEPE